MSSKYIEIQEELIQRYKINIVKNSTCRSRTHAHCDGSRRICKWNQVNSLQSLFTLAHEIGHIMTKTSKMRRCESEYYATVWAIQELDRYNIKPTEKDINDYQKYIYMELDRGLRRGGSNYLERSELDLSKCLDVKLKLKSVPKNLPIIKTKKRIEL